MPKTVKKAVAVKKGSSKGVVKPLAEENKQPERNHEQQDPRLQSKSESNGELAFRPRFCEVVMNLEYALILLNKTLMSVGANASELNDRKRAVARELADILQIHQKQWNDMIAQEEARRVGGAS